MKKIKEQVLNKVFCRKKLLNIKRFPSFSYFTIYSNTYTIKKGTKAISSLFQNFYFSLLFKILHKIHNILKH